MIVDFKNISIRGRVAYEIVVLEEVIKLHYEISEWELVLNKLKEFTETKIVENWYYEFAEYLCESILENKEFREEEFEFITETQFYDLYSLYSKIDKEICEIISNIFYTATTHLYGKIEFFGLESLDYFNQVIKVGKRLLGDDLPKTTLFEGFVFEENMGWGRPFLYDIVSGNG